MKTTKSVIHFKVFYGLLMATMVTLPFTIFFMLPIAIILLINFILEWNWKDRYRHLITSKSVSLFIALSALFLLYTIGITYSSNLLNGVSNLETKLWFFCTPFIIFSTNKEYLTKDRCYKLIFVFIIACTVMALGNICYSLIQYITTGNSSFFYYLKATHFPYYHPTHPSYLAMYLTFSSIAILYFIFIAKIMLKKWVKITFIISLPLFATFIFLLQSRAGILVFGLLFFCFVLYIINHKKAQIGVSILFTVLMVISIFLLFRFAHTEI